MSGDLEEKRCWNAAVDEWRLQLRFLEEIQEPQLDQNHNQNQGMWDEEAGNHLHVDVPPPAQPSAATSGGPGSGAPWST